MGCKILIGLLFLTLFTYNSIPYKSDVDLVLYYWTIFLLVSSLYVFFRCKKKSNYFDFDTIFLALCSIMGFLATNFYNESYFHLLFWGIPFDEQFINTGNLIFLLGMQTFMLGSLSFSREYKKECQGRIVDPFYGCIFFLLMLLFFILSGGITYYKSMYLGEEVGSGGVYSYMLLLCIIVVNVNTSIMFYNRRIDPDYKMSKLFYISVIIFALLLLYIGRRSFFIFLILPFVALYTRSYKGISVKKFVLFAILGIILFWVVQNTRTGKEIETSNLNPVFLVTDLTIPSRATYSAMEYVEQNGYAYGKSMSSGLIGIIPFLSSFFDATKTYSASVLTKFTFDSLKRDDTFGLGTTIIADIFLSWGVVGIIFFMFLLGRITAYITCKTKTENLYYLTFYSIMVSQCAFMIRDSLFASLRLYIWAAVFVWCIKHVTFKIGRK